MHIDMQSLAVHNARHCAVHFGHMVQRRALGASNLVYRRLDNAMQAICEC